MRTLDQEDINDMMMTPEESDAYHHPKEAAWNRCPRCGENYSGNGGDLCVACQVSLYGDTRGRKYGFDALQLLGILEWKRQDVINQMKGLVRPDIVTRTLVTDVATKGDTDD